MDSEALRPPDSKLSKGKPRAASGSCFNPSRSGTSWGSGRRAEGRACEAGAPLAAFRLLAIREARGPRRTARHEITQELCSQRLRGPRTPADPTTRICRPDHPHHFQRLQTGSPLANSCHTPAIPGVGGGRGALVCDKKGPEVPWKDTALSQLARPRRLHGPRACPAAPAGISVCDSFPSCWGTRCGPRHWAGDAGGGQAAGGSCPASNASQSTSASPAASLAAARAARTHPSRLIAKAFGHRPLPRWGRRGQMGSRRTGRALGVSPKGAGDWGLGGGGGGGEQQCGSSKDSPRGQNLETRLARRRDG